MPGCSCIEGFNNSMDKFHLCTSIIKILKKKWKNYYASQLQRNPKWYENIEKLWGKICNASYDTSILKLISDIDNKMHHK